MSSIKFDFKFALAPMAGFSDYAMRRICGEFGAQYTVTEMISAKATVFGDKKTLSLAKITTREPPCAIQIFGSEPQIMAEAAAFLSSYGGAGAKPIAIDINMGCPVNKIFKNGEGSALMKNPSLIYEITKSVSSAIRIPTTVKMRLGVDSAHINASECAIAAEEGGAALITLHARTREQLYSGEADMEKIRDVAQKVTIPVLANGDITTPEDAVRAIELTGAKGVMIGRGAIGNPFIFEEIISYIEGKPYTPPTVDKIKETALRELSYAIEDKGERVAVMEARGRLAKYFHSFRGAGELRARINLANTREDIEAAIKAVFPKI